MISCGLLGKVLGHSYSPVIHSKLGDYRYVLYEKTEEEVEDFILNGNWTGLNVTMPYKKTVVRYADELSEEVEATGSANTLVKRNGRIYAYNTDVSGFTNLVSHYGFTVSGKKALVLGSGGASVAVRYALMKKGAKTVVISRSGADNYNNLQRHADASLIVNTTPCGMFPNNGESPVDLTAFPSLTGVIDIVYNPTRTALLLQAERLGIPFAGGLYMLVSQAKKSSELFTSKTLPDEITESIRKSINNYCENVILIGMPGSGKTAVARRLAKITGRTAIDTDEEIYARTGKTPADIIMNSGERAFREIESDVLKDLCKRSSVIISTGGGAVTVDSNYPVLHQNGKIYWIKRSPYLLPTDGRPLSQEKGISGLYNSRKPLYEKFADYEIDNDGGIDDAVNAILATISE